MAQWMRLCVGALKEFLGHTGLPTQRPLDHEGANDQELPPRPMIIYWRIESGKCLANRTWGTRRGTLPELVRSLKAGLRMPRWRKPGAPWERIFTGRL